MSARHVGRATRVVTSLQVGAACLLAFGAAVLAIDLADGAYVRTDLSRSGRNTLQPEVAEVIERLPEPVRIDVFFRPLAAPYDGISLEAHGRMLELLFTAQNAHRDRLQVELYDDATVERTRARQGELGIQGTNRMVVTCGERRTMVRLFGGVVTVDWGNPTPRGVRYLSEQGIGGVVDPQAYDPTAFRPARITAFRGQEALAEALLKVASGTRPRVLFTTGHGEPDPQGTLSTDVSRLWRQLERDGFDVGLWNGAEEPEVPPDTEVLLALGARQPYREEERAAIQRYVEAGGRLIAAPSYQEVEEGLAGGTAALLFGHGMIVAPGVVCEPLVDALGRSLEGLPENSRLVLSGSELSPSHPLTEALRRRGLRLEFVLSHAFRRGGVRAGGLLLDLIHSSQDSWRDLAGADGRRDYRFDALAEERGRQRLVMLAELPSSVPEEGGEVRRGRVLGVASAAFFADASFDTNRDFLLSAVNWMAEREQLVRVRPRTVAGNVLDLRRGRAKPVLSGLFVFGLPGALAVVGLLLGWRRRR